MVETWRGGATSGVVFRWSSAWIAWVAGARGRSGREEWELSAVATFFRPFVGGDMFLDGLFMVGGSCLADYDNVTDALSICHIDD